MTDQTVTCGSSSICTYTWYYSGSGNWVPLGSLAYTSEGPLVYTSDCSSCSNPDDNVYVSPWPLQYPLSTCNVERKFEILDRSEETKKHDSNETAPETPEQKEKRLQEFWIKDRKDSFRKSITPPYRRSFVSPEEIKKLELDLMSNVEKLNCSAARSILRFLYSSNRQCPKCGLKLIPYGYDLRYFEVVLGCAGCFESYDKDVRLLKSASEDIERRFIKVYLDGPFCESK